MIDLNRIIYMRHVQDAVQDTLSILGYKTYSLYDTFETLGLDRFELIELNMAINSWIGEDLIDPVSGTLDQSVFELCHRFYVAYEAVLDSVKEILNSEPSPI